MIRFHLFFALVVLFVGAGASAMSLMDVYESAEGASERVQIAEVELRQAEERKKQVWGGLLPSVRLSHRVLAQDIPPASPGQNVPSAFRQEQQTTTAVALVQPLFRGGAEFAAYKSATLSIDVQRENQRQVNLLLLEGIAGEFYEILALEEELKVLARLKSALQERVRELSRRANIGQARTSELLSARAQVQATEVEIITVTTQIQDARRALAQSAFVPENQIFEDRVSVPKDIPSLEIYKEKIQALPSIQVAEKNLEIADQQRRFERSGHWPQVDVQGNYYFERPGVLADSKWDVTLNLTVPLFQGGVVSSRVREVTYEKARRQLELTQLQREVAVLLSDRHANLKRVQGSLGNLRDSVELYRRSYELLDREYRSGIISYLEVNPTERDYWESLRRLQRQEAEYKLAWVQLQAVVGEMP